MTSIELADYEIKVGPIALQLEKFLLEKSYARLFVLIDENTKKYCYPLIKDLVETYPFYTIEILAGESQKNIHTCNYIWGQLLKHEAQRKDLFINLGGGVIGDMGGFCASTFKRGMDFVQIPSTLLAQVDASIGGKLGIDFEGVKNSIGLFKNPDCVFLDPLLLKTLDRRQFLSGYAEMIKHSLIADKVQWGKISQQGNPDLDFVVSILEESLRIKKEIVEQDPFEKKERKALNFGHTIGHAVESQALVSDKNLLHGEAVAIGIVAESYLSHQKGYLKLEELKNIQNLIFQIYTLPPIEERTFEELWQWMKQDKKNENTDINFTFLNAIGHALVNQRATYEETIESLLYYNQHIPTK